jgi:hypothetical protein
MSELQRLDYGLVYLGLEKGEEFIKQLGVVMEFLWGSVQFQTVCITFT